MRNPTSATAARDGDPGAGLAGAVELHGRRWLAAAQALTGDRPGAEDLLQTVLLATVARRQAFGDVDAADAYVRRSLRNQHISNWRRHRRSQERLVAEVPEPAAVDADGLPERDELWRLVERLPDAQRNAVALRYFADMSEAQAAELLGCSIGTIKSNTSRGLRRLRSLVQLLADTSASHVGPSRPPADLGQVVA